MHDKGSNALDILALLQITDKQIGDLQRFTLDTAPSNETVKLILQVKNYVNNATWFQKHKSQLGAFVPFSLSNDELRTPSSQIGIVSADSVLSKFVSAHASWNDDSSNVLINSLLQSFAAKINGRMSTPNASNLIDSCQAIRHKPKSACSFLMGNLLLPSVRHFVRLKNINFDESDLIISTTKTSMTNTID